MIMWFTGSTINVNETEIWHLGCQASPAVREEGAVDHIPCLLMPVCCSLRLPPKWMLALGCWLSQGLRNVAKQPALRWGCLQ